MPRPPDAALAVVEDAPVAHESPPLRGRNDVAERGGSILPRQGWRSSLLPKTSNVVAAGDRPLDPPVASSARQRRPLLGDERQVMVHMSDGLEHQLPQGYDT